MQLEADYPADMIAAAETAAPVRSTLAYFVFSVGAFSTLAILPAVIAILAARGFR